MGLKSGWNVFDFSNNDFKKKYSTKKFQLPPFWPLEELNMLRLEFEKKNQNFYFFPLQAKNTVNHRVFKIFEYFFLTRIKDPVWERVNLIIGYQGIVGMVEGWTHLSFVPVCQDRPMLLDLSTKDRISYRKR